MLVLILIVQVIILCIFLSILCYHVFSKKSFDYPTEHKTFAKSICIVKYLVVIIWVTLSLFVALLWFWFFVIN